MASRLLAADLRPLRPYDVKHTGVALLALAGVDPSEIARRAGHSSVAFIYDRYGHLFPEIDNQAAQRLEGGRSAASSGGNG
jgi:integrase